MTSETTPDPESPCPRCKGALSQAWVPSRVDDKTPICEHCATDEGRWMGERPNRPLPHISNPIPAL